MDVADAARLSRSLGAHREAAIAAALFAFLASKRTLPRVLSADLAGMPDAAALVEQFKSRWPGSPARLEACASSQGLKSWSAEGCDSQRIVGVLLSGRMTPPSQKKVAGSSQVRLRRRSGHMGACRILGVAQETMLARGACARRRCRIDGCWPHGGGTLPCGHVAGG